MLPGSEVKGGGVAAERKEGEGNRGEMSPWGLLGAFTAEFGWPENVHFTFMFMNTLNIKCVVILLWNKSIPDVVTYNNNLFLILYVNEGRLDLIWVGIGRAPLKG